MRNEKAVFHIYLHTYIYDVKIEWGIVGKRNGSEWIWSKYLLYVKNVIRVHITEHIKYIQIKN